MGIDNDLLLNVEIAGYGRLSNDDELDKDNTSIENQKSIITEFARKMFPKCRVTFYSDRDVSGYTFTERPDYQRMRKRLLSGEIRILIVKDFSRFARRNSKGLVELEDLRDAGVRIISIGDNIDYPTYDDWTAIQFRFLINEMPVTDASKKVKASIKIMQNNGQWINVVPYGYVITNMKRHEFEIVPDEAEIIRKVFDLYNEGWGYKKISNYLTENKIPTPRMKEKQRIEERGDVYKRKGLNDTWSIVTVQGILTNDFYIGTLRQRKYMRKNINGKDVLRDESEQIVFDGHHEPIVDYKVWLLTQDQLKQRSVRNYRGIKKYDNVYSGFLFCGDCGAPMFSMSRGDMAPAYTCGTYHKRGLKGCTSHHTRVDMLDAVLKSYVKRVRDNSKDMIHELEKSIKSEESKVEESENTMIVLDRYLDEAKEELKSIKKRKIRELTRLEAKAESKADAEMESEILEETYAELEAEATDKIKGLRVQIAQMADKRNDIIKLNRLARTVMDVFDDIVKKKALDKTDVQILVEKIVIYEDHIDVKLKSDIDSILKCGVLAQGKVSNFNKDSKVILNSNGRRAMMYMSKLRNDNATKVQLKTRNQPERLFTVNVISSGDPSLTILTDYKEMQENQGLQELREDLFVNGIIGFASRIGI